MKLHLMYALRHATSAAAAMADLSWSVDIGASQVVPDYRRRIRKSLYAALADLDAYEIAQFGEVTKVEVAK